MMKHTTRTRTLAMALALASLFLLVPSLALPLAAAEETPAWKDYESTFDTTTAYGTQYTVSAEPYEGTAEKVTQNCVKWTGDWQFGYRSGSNFTPYTSWESVNSIACYGANNQNDLWGKGGLYKNGTVVATGNVQTTLRYTAPYDGTLNWGAAITTRDNAGLHIFRVEQNGYQVYPVSTGVATEKANTYETGALSLAVRAGDTVDLIVTRQKVDGNSSWFAAKIVATASYAAGYAEITRIIDNLPDETAAEEVNSVTYKNGWEYIVYPGGDMTGAAVVPKNRMKGGDTSTVYSSIYDGTGQIGEYNTGKSVLVFAGNDYWGKKGTLSPMASDIAGFRYTVEKTGFVLCSFNEIGAFAKTGSGVPMEDANAANSSFAIFVGGEKVWPAGEEWKTFESIGHHGGDADLSYPAEIFVSAGTVIEFLVRDNRTVGGQSNHQSRGVAVFGSVAYTGLTSDVSITGAASLGSRIAFRFGEPQADAAYFSNVTLKNVTCTAEDAVFAENVITGIKANEMTAEITYELHADITTPLGEKRTDVLFERKTTSVAAYLRTLIGDATQTAETRDLAISVLHYGAEAQKYFATGPIPEKELADYGIGAVSFDTTEPKSDYAQSADAAARYAFSSASLLLQDELRVKVSLDLLDGKTAADLAGLRLQVAGNEAFSGASTYEVIARTDDVGGKYLKAYFAVPANEFARKFYVRLVDAEGNAVSTTLTYSVSSYITRMSGDVTSLALLTAIHTLGTAATRYAGATA